MSPMTNALIQYWQRLHAEPPAVRRRCLDAACGRVRLGAEPRSVLLPYALADTDEDVVAAATQAYLRAGASGTTVDSGAAGEAVDWVRRGLALNRGAVFGALLAQGEEATLERLLALRLVLSAPEVEAACRVLGPEPAERAVEFLVDWLVLLADGPLDCGQRAIAETVQGWERAEAA
jgi:hypothetical protein